MTVMSARRRLGGRPLQQARDRWRRKSAVCPASSEMRRGAQLTTEKPQVSLYNLSLVLRFRAMGRSRGRRPSRGGLVLARFRRVLTGALAGIFVGLIASHAGSQEPSPPTTTEQP